METRPFSAVDDMSQIDALFRAAGAADHRDPLSDHKHLDLARGNGVAIVMEEADQVIAFAQVSDGRRGNAVEMVVAPDRRTGDVIERLLDRALELAGGGAEVWAFDPAQVEAIAGRGLTLARSVHQLRRSLPPDAQAVMPPGFEVHPFRVGRDEQAWLDVNNGAFAGHPENSGWDRAVLDERIAQPWFSAAGFLMAWSDNRLAGFCWTKLHPGDVGEIYVIAVAPGFQGKRLGKALALSGLWYLHDGAGARIGMLYVDGTNERGIGLYESLGFEVARTDYCFQAGAADR